MSTSEIIEFKGRKFQRLGIMEFPQCGQWYLLGRLPVVATRNHADFETKIKRELLRELPAETPARHGKDCPKVEHVGGGWLHDATDDSPYDVDGVSYCGRCHGWMGNPAASGSGTPAETPAVATCHFPFIPGKTPNGQDKIPRTCEKCGAYPVVSGEDKHHGLLAEAEEALQAFAVWGKECDNPRPSEAEIERQFQLFAKCRAVLARIRAAKEKH